MRWSYLARLVPGRCQGRLQALEGSSVGSLQVRTAALRNCTLAVLLRSCYTDLESPVYPEVGVDLALGPRLRLPPGASDLERQGDHCRPAEPHLPAPRQGDSFPLHLPRLSHNELLSPLINRLVGDIRGLQAFWGYSS